MLAMIGRSTDCGKRAFERVQTDVLAFAVSYPQGSKTLVQCGCTKSSGKLGFMARGNVRTHLDRCVARPHEQYF
jgi:hypothetical protein